MASVEPRRTRMRKRLRNALRMLGRGGVTPPYRAPFEVVAKDPIVSLRCYHRSSSRRPVLLVPPLMVTSEIYDIAPELSAVAFLARHDVPTYLTDFGPPERQEGGLERTLDDHVLGVSRAVDRLRAVHGEDVHLVGYSQGGMFCYQAAAYRRSEGIASVVTFGSPVDIRRNAPFALNDQVADKLIGGLRRLIDRPLEGLTGLPGTMSSRGFKLLAPLQELRHLIALFGVLHDEEALAKIEPKRRFLGGEGFIAWPGPALRAFIDQFVVENRMKHGGFIIDGRTVALADITSPICFLVGESDDFAQPDAVRAITRAAPNVQCYPVHVDAGHFGLVVGRAAMSVCWPTVDAWTRWQDGHGPRPAILDEAATASPPDEAARSRPRELFAGSAEQIWERLGGLGVRLGKASDAVRWQLPRVLKQRLLELSERASFDAHVSLSRTLRERAREVPEAVAFVYSGRAFTFAHADLRVDAAARALAGQGVRIGTRVAVIGRSHPDPLTALVALNRLGAAAVLLAGRRELDVARAGDPELLVIDDEPPEPDQPREPLLFDPGRTSDEALVLGAASGSPQSLDNQRWIGIGLDLAIAARLTATDTVFCPPTLELGDLTLALSAALQGAARLQLGRPGTPTWPQILNSGATVLVADEELARELADAPRPGRHPVRFVFGAELPSEIAQALTERLGERTRYRSLR